MKRILSALSALFMACGAAHAAPALWVVSDEDTTIHLFGTIHALPPELDWRTAEFDAAFAAADTLCIEVNIFERAPEVISLTFKEGIFKGDERLSDYLDEEQEAMLREVAAEVNLLWVGLDLMKPWNAMFTLAGGLAMKAGLADDSGVEYVLYEEALADGKTICEMESLDEQLGGLIGLPFDIQVTALTMVDEEYADLPVPEQLDKAVEELRGMVGDWAVGNVAAMQDTFEDFGHRDVYDAILTDRNARWAERIEAMLGEPGNVFIAVGAGHLAGPDSVQVMLEARGIEVEGPEFHFTEDDEATGDVPTDEDETVSEEMAE
jgi:uncharacterized protein